MILKAKCPTMGRGYIWFAPEYTPFVKNDSTSIQDAYKAY